MQQNRNLGQNLVRTHVAYNQYGNLPQQNPVLHPTTTKPHSLEPKHADTPTNYCTTNWSQCQIFDESVEEDAIIVSSTLRTTSLLGMFIVICSLNSSSSTVSSTLTS